MNRARQLWHYLTKVFDLPRRLRAVRTDRPAAQIPLPKLDAYDVRTIWQLGHRRWGIENELFNVLTQHYHLTHCPHHHPVAILAGLLFLVLGFVLFGVFAQVHGKLLGWAQTTRREIAAQLDRGLERREELQPLWSG